jgi:hypothetical protein
LKVTEQLHCLRIWRHLHTLQAYVTHLLEMYVLAFALLFSAVGSCLVEVDDAENARQAVTYMLLSFSAVMSLVGTGMGLSGCVIFGDIVLPKFDSFLFLGNDGAF